MNITQLTVGVVQTNCYIVAREGMDSCVVIDPGAEAGNIAAEMEKKGLRCGGILLTHGHFDHILGVPELVSLTGADVYAYEGEKELLRDPSVNCSGAVGEGLGLEPEHLLRDKETFALADITFQVIATPGHTAGGCCYYVEDGRALFSGDTIFMESVGRTDLPTGNMEKLIGSVRNRVLTLPGDVLIYPGHGPATSVEYERQNNPYCRQGW